MEQLKKIGRITPKRSLDIKESKLGIGFEKLDRNVFDPEKAYDKLALVGVKWVRIQSGWQRTERVKGQYDFGWIDTVVDNLIERGMRPWICLCYGNELYNEEGKEVFGAVGIAPIFNDEQKTGWANYVKATVIGGVICTFGSNLAFTNEALAAGMDKAIDALSFHEYTPDESKLFEHIPALAALVHSYNPDIKIIQGESGSQSRSDGCGALRGGAWTPERQAKQCVRHAIADLMIDVEFTSYFSCMDMIEALNGKVGDKNSYLDYGYFGILGADFDENGFSSGEYSPKPSYYAYQNVCSVFAEGAEVCDLPIVRITLPSKRLISSDYGGSLIFKGFRKPNGATAFAYWNSTPLLTTTFESTVSFRATNLKGDIHLVDLLHGDIYEIPADMLEDAGYGTVTIKNIPVTDYPLLLTFGDFAE